jgi:hypothetical protein
MGENGSKDDTRRIVERSVEEGRAHLEDTAFMSAVSNRYQRMAIGREHLKRVLELSVSKTRYVCVADLDTVMAVPPSAREFSLALTSLQADKRIFAVSATTTPFFYDLIAFEDEVISYERLPEVFYPVRRNPLTYYKFAKENIYAKQKSLTSYTNAKLKLDGSLVCISSFNGMCIYKSEYYKLGSYIAKNNINVCEHLVLNRSISKNSNCKMMISPHLILKTPPEHTPKNFITFLRHRLTKRLRSWG